MNRSDRKEMNGDTCLIAAEEVQRKLMALARKIERPGDPSVRPDRPLPVDDFLSEMVKRPNAPRIIIKPKRLKDEIWTESMTAYAYAGIEAAFVKAGNLPGGNRSGHVRELKRLKGWIEKQEKNPNRPLPKYFAQSIALLFAEGILKERRQERIEVIQKLEQSTPSGLADLAQLKTWVDKDLADHDLRKKGRPTDYQKIVFAAEIANLWNELTGKPIAKGPETNFARFVAACWKSGFVDMDVNSNFKRVLRHHIGEREDPHDSDRREHRSGPAKSERKRYFGILM